MRTYVGVWVYWAYSSAA